MSTNHPADPASHPNLGYPGQADILRDELRAAWRHAVRALNTAESAELKDTRAALAEIVVRLSQQYEYVHDGRP